jgi:putative sigma-54 modulation protein
VRTAPGELKPMSVEDAVLAMQDSRDGFLVFRNARSQRVNVVYRRGDGRYGVIEA